MNATPAVNARIARRNSIIAAHEAAEEALSTATRRADSALYNAERAEKVAAIVRSGGQVNESTLDDMHLAASKVLGWRAYDLTTAAALPYYLEAVAAQVKATVAALDAARAAFGAAEKAYNRLRF